MAFGLSRRDYFAAAALTGLLSSTTADDRKQLQKQTDDIPEGFARIAFQMGDAMLKESEKQ